MAASSLGDIMGGTPGQLPTLGEFEPLERVLLTANGNLQRLVSSYHNTSVSVRVVYSREVATGEFERKVALLCGGTEFAEATSRLHITRADCISAIADGGVAIGQLFRHLNILPTFELTAAGRDAGGEQIWRDYLLSGEGVVCEIHERIRSDVLGALVSPSPSAPCDSADDAGDTNDAGGPAADAAGDVLAPSDGPGGGRVSAKRPRVAPSFGDIMSPHMTGVTLPNGFSPLQRLLLTANGNVERIVSSFYYEPLTVLVNLNHKRSPCVYDRQASAAAAAAPPSLHTRTRTHAEPRSAPAHRAGGERGLPWPQVTMLVRGEPFLHAKSTIYLTDPAWEEMVERRGTPLGAVFRVMGARAANIPAHRARPARPRLVRRPSPAGVLPTFHLRSVGRGRDSSGSGFFWRVYTLASQGMTCEITETFADDTFEKRSRGSALDASLASTDGHGIPV